MERFAEMIRLADAEPQAAGGMTDTAAFKAAIGGLRKAAPAEPPPSPFPPSLRPVTEVAGQTPTGRWMLEALEHSQVSIRTDDAYLDRMAPPGLRMMAAYDPASKSIVLRGGTDPEATASLLVHEGRHALQDKAGVLAFDRQPWRYGAGGFMEGIRTVEADAHALQAQFAYERLQDGHPAAWQFMRRHKPVTAEAFERSVREAPANLENGQAMRAAFDAFLGDPVEIKTYNAMNLPQWLSSLREAPSGQAVGQRSFDPQPMAAMVRQGPKDYLAGGAPPQPAPGLDPAADAQLTHSARDLVTLLRAPAERRSELLKQDEYQATLRLFRLSPQDVDHIAQASPPPAARPPAVHGR